jgi:hypothetical protein
MPRVNIEAPLEPPAPTLPGAVPDAPAEAGVDAVADAPAGPGAPLRGGAPVRYRHWRHAFRVGLLVWLASRVGLVCATTFSWIGDARPGLSVSAAAHKWADQFDSAWFVAAAERGYVRTPDLATAAFFPLYPATIRAFTPLFFGHAWVAALFVSNAALLAALVLLYRLVETEFGRGSAGRATFYLVAFPTGFFLTAAYNESLFIALVLGCVYGIRRGNWWVAGLLGGLAAATRSAGVLLLLPFCYEYVRQRGWRVGRDVFATALIPLGLAAVMIVDQVAFGDALAFSKAQGLRWGRHLNWPWTAIADTIGDLFRADPWYQPFGEIWLHNLLDLATTLLTLALVVAALVGPYRFARDKLVFPLWGLAMILFMISFPTTLRHDIPYPLVSTSRLGLEIIPAFLVLGRLGRHPWFDRALLVVFLPLQGILLARYLHGGWVA